jgi:hypothetical protein
MGSDTKGSIRPDTADLDLAWEDASEEAPSTVNVDSVELLRRAAASRESTASMPVPVDQRATVPPPVPASEYVAHMMMQAPESDRVRARTSSPFPERHRGPLSTLYEEDPLQFDLDEEPPGAPINPTLASELGPTIETAIASDLPAELLRETPVPTIELDELDALELDELDALPVDDVLAAVSLRPVDIKNAQRGGRADLSLEPHSTTPAPAAISDIPVSKPDPWADVHARSTMPGFDPTDPIGKVHDRFIVGDYSGALVLAEGLLEEQPEHLEAQRYAESCRDMLRQMYLSRLGSGDQVPHVVMAPDQLRWLTLDHRAGFLLSCIDGTSTVDDVLDVCGMASLDALRILYELVSEGVIQMEPPASSKRAKE